jgi:hypothetical protein
MTNKEFSTNNQLFKCACELASVEPTKRQASKWRRDTGKAFGFREEAHFTLEWERRTRTRTH